VATTTTATSGFSDLVQELVKERAEEELRARLVHAMPGNFLPGRLIKGTNFIRFARYADLSVSTTALTEATAPTDQELTIASEAFSATQYGGTIAVSDLANLDSPHELISIAAEKAARQAADTIDVLVRDVLQAGASVKYSNGAARSAVSAALTGALVKQMFWNLQKRNVPTFADGTYRAIITPNQAYDLEADTATGGWMDVHKYVDNSPLLTNEIGRYAGVRFMVSSNAKVFATAGASSVDVHSAFFFGPQSYTIGDSQTLSAYFVPPGGDHTDPLAQKAIVGWKVRFGAMLLDEAGPRYVRLETAATTV